jgi:hypothetical protein
LRQEFQSRTQFCPKTLWVCFSRYCSVVLCQKKKLSTDSRSACSNRTFQVYSVLSWVILTRDGNSQKSSVEFTLDICLGLVLIHNIQES